MNLTPYLERNVNQQPSAERLAQEIAKSVGAGTCNVFLCVPGSEVVECLTGKSSAPSCGSLHIHTIDEQTQCRLSPPTQNSLVIPVMIGSDRVGILSVSTRKAAFTQEDVAFLKPAVSLLQIVLNGLLHARSLTQIYSDDNFLSRDLFLANLSHEIKTPLSGIVGYNQLLMQTALTQTQKHYVHNMSQCSVSLMRLVNDILDFSKLASNKMTLHKDCFNLAEIIHTVKKTMSQDLQSKRQKLEFVTSVEMPPFVITDKQKVIQILVNLINNASKFSTIESEIFVRVVAESPSKARVCVEDTGIGISEQDQCKLFNSFVQISNSVTKSGSGLGLAISKKLTELLGGEISVRSVLGQGSTFSFTFAFQTVDSFEDAITKDAGILKGRTVLLVDDNRENRILIADMLFGWDMQPVVCASALEALRMVMGNRYTFDLGLLDICMPGTSGVELAKQIKAERPMFPLIALSSADDVETKDFEQCLQKPVNRTQLFNAIYSVVSQNSGQVAYIGSVDDAQIQVPTCPADRFDTSAQILVAEDIPYNQAMLVEMLQLLGYTNVSTASNGADAISALEAEPCMKVLLLDLRMPVRDGYAVLDHVSTRCPFLKVVAVSASVLTEDRDRCRNYGVRYFISKPINITVLKQVMLKVTEKQN